MYQEISVKCVRDIDQLETYAAAWDELTARCPEQLPQSSHAWVSTFLKYRLKPEQRWCCLIALQGTQFVGVLPVIISHRKLMGFSCTELRTPGDSHTRSVALLAAPENEAQVVRAIISSLDAVDPKWSWLYMERIPVLSPAVKCLYSGGGNGLGYHELANLGAFLPTVGVYADYRKSLKPKWRSNLTNYSNRLSSYENVRYECGEVQSTGVDGLSRFLEVENANWKGREGSAIAKIPDLVEFYMALADRLSRRGWLQLHFLVAEGKTIAGAFDIKCGRSLFGHKMGYDENYSKCSPGNILLECVLRHAFESPQIDRMELISDPPWAQNWNVQKREFHHVWFYRKRAVPLLLGYFPRIVRRKLRQISFLRAAVRYVRRLIDRPAA
ncbi:MAG: GNAT family N-acetyltransferase [Candidatus Zixiibacteriota bacterium]